MDRKKQPKAPLIFQEMTGQEKMLFAKHHPGVTEAPYINNGEMTALRTGVVKSNLFIGTCLDLDGQNPPIKAPIGTRSYVILALSTSFSVLPQVSG